MNPNRTRSYGLVNRRAAALPALFALLAVLPGSASAQDWPASAGPICESPDRPEGSVVRGEARDLLTLRPIPGVELTLRSTTATGIRILGRTRTGPDGTYTFCGVPPMGGLNVQGELVPVTSRVVRVSDDPEAEAPPVYLRTTEPADIEGVVIDGGTGEPIEGAQIELEGRPARSLTDAEGRFQITGLGAGELVIRTSHVAYQPRVDSVDIASADRLDFEIFLHAEVIALAPIVVRARSRGETDREAAASRVDFMTRAQVDSVLPMVTDIASLIRSARFLGVEIERRSVGGVCVTISRRTRSLTPEMQGSECNMVAVYVDGVPLMDPSVQLLEIDPATVATMRFLDPAEAQIRYGNTGAGVLVITLR